jgi:hypothetical protein
MKTYVLIQKEPRAADARLADTLAAVPGVQRVLQVEGPFDIVAEVEGHDAWIEQAAPLISSVDGVLRAIPLHVVGDEEAEATATIDARSLEELRAEPCNA